MTSLHVESAPATPLVWFSATIRGGAAADPIGLEGVTRHVAELSRRGIPGYDRAALDAAIDALGGSLDVEIDRDGVAFTGMALKRNLDRVLALAAGVLGAPTLDAAEHDQLLRETHHEIDDLRDDDATLVDRFFNVHAAPGHSYGRTTLGADATLARMDLAAARAQRERMWSRDRLVLGFAGAITAAEADAAAARLADAVGARAVPPLEPLVEVATPPGRTIVVVDKPARSQCQMLIGHTAPRYGTDDFMALSPVETAFGGMFTSRLMQEIRVKRGWSYGAGCRLYKARIGHWFRINLAPTAEVAADALALVFDQYRALVDDGVAPDELDFARGYLTGSLALSQQTARQRLRQRVQHDVLGLPADFLPALPRRLAAVTREEAVAAARRWLTPDALCAVVIATADQLVPKLEAAGMTVSAVVPYDSY